MDKKKIFVALPNNKERETFFTKKVLSYIENITNVEFLFNSTKDYIAHADKYKYLENMDGLILGWGCGKYPSEVLNKFPKLKIVGVLGGALSPYIDLDFFSMDKVLINSADVMAQSVAEATLAYMLTALRDISYYDYSMKHLKPWRSNDFENQGLFYKTIGLIGLGAVGRYLLEMLKPFNVKVLIYDPYLDFSTLNYNNVEKKSLDEVLINADIVSIHAAYTKETHYLIDYEKIKLMKKNALLVNTARGPIIKEKDLIKALEEKHIKAALDVFEQEPLEDTSPLRKLDNVVLIPHMGGPTVDVRQYMALSLIDDIIDFFNNRPISNIITEHRFKITSLA